jgi:hypothetical protein
MKNIVLFAFCCGIMSCKPAATPPLNITESKSKNTTVDTMSDRNRDEEEEDSQSTPKITCDVQAKVIEKFESPSVTIERLSFTGGSDKQAEWIKISVPNQPCKIVDITNASRQFYKLEDWDKDGFQDLMEINTHGHSSTFRVHWFDKTKNDFIKIDKALGGECEVFDASKSLFIDANDDAELRYNYDFSNTYTLFYFKKGVFKSLAQITFFMDGHKKDDKFSVTVKKYKSAKDETGTPIETSFFNELAPKAETLHKQRVSEQETYTAKWTTEMSTEQRENLRKEHDQYDAKIQLLHKEWTERAQPMVIQYWKDNLATFWAE